MAKLYYCDTKPCPGYGNRLWIKKSLIENETATLAKLSMWGGADKTDRTGKIIAYELDNENLEKARKFLNENGFTETQDYKEIGLE